MNEKTFALLEFPAIREACAACSLSEEAAELILESTPRREAAEVRDLKSLVSAALDRINSGDGEPVGQLPRLDHILPKLGVEGASLEIEEAFALGIFAERGEALRTWLAGAEPSGGIEAAGPLAPILAEIPGCAAAAGEVFRVLDREGRMRDLPELREIRRRIRSLSGELDGIISRYTGAEETRNMLRSAVPSQRDGRMVLAVKANFRGRVKGIVHEVSASGRTIFLEPEDVVEKNNDILLENRRLDAEIRRILRELAGKLSGMHGDLLLFHRGILRLETLRAKARYSREIRGHFAGEGEDMILKGARHPLLGGRAIPIDLEMRARRVIITGPNTGGKTVTLKTAGLLALMNQWGLALPCGEETSLPVFDGIFADIGDEQSLSQSLSTFSAHMTNVAAIAESAGDRSLVLLDELGSGTDPQEGSAIAMSILDHLAEKGARVIVTTHHGALKNYGYTRGGVENASVEFDRRTLAPTYRIVMGIPGESRAVDIAARNGVPDGIIQGARSYLAGDQADLSALIAELKTRRQDLEIARGETGREEERLREERRLSDLRELKLRQRELELKSGGMGEFRLLLRDARKTLENLVREVREGELSRDKTMKVKTFLNDLALAVDGQETALEEEDRLLREERGRLDAEAAEAPARENGAAPRADRKKKTRGSPEGKTAIGPGTEVLMGKWKRRGTVVRREKDGWLVEAGSLRLTLPEGDLVPLEPPKTAPKPQIETTGLSAGGEAKFELSLRGMRLDEALEALRRQLDAALVAGLGEFSVIHGKGDGVLQQGVHNYLRERREVADYYFSRPELGGFGRTEVILKG